MKNLLLLVLLLFRGVFFSQNDRAIDSLKIILKSSKNDSNKVIVLFKLSSALKQSKSEESLKFSEECLTLASGLKWQKGIAYGYLAKGQAYFWMENIDKALEYSIKALDLRKQLKDEKGIIESYNFLGGVYIDMSEHSKALDCFSNSISLSDKLLSNKEINKKRRNEILSDNSAALISMCVIYRDKGEYNLAIKYGLKAQKIEEELYDYSSKNKTDDLKGRKKNLARVYGNLGSVYQAALDEKKTIEYMQKCYSIFEELKNEKNMAMALSTIGHAHQNTNIDEALNYQIRAKDILEKFPPSISLANVYSSIGLIYKKKGNYEKANDFEFKALKIFEVAKYPRGIIGSFGNIATNYKYLKQYNKALQYVEKSIILSREMGVAEFETNSLFLLAEIHDKLGNYKKAFKYYQDHIFIRDSLFNTERQKEVVKQTMNFEFEKKKATDSIKNVEQKKQSQLIHEKQIYQQKSYAVGGAIGFALMLIVALISFKAYRQKQKANVLISQQKVEVETQKHLVEEHQKEILDSIHYAKRIQTALLANKNLVDSHIENNFVLFKPKDIVSGDFYWATEHNNKFYLATCDSTGHGVPGAFMSLLNMGFLSEAIKEKDIERPNEIFDFVRTRLENTISKEGQKDGMDGILICLDKKTKKITYAAANNEPILISEGQVIELPKDKMPVGKGERSETFTLHSVNANSGDTLYLYTDGFADQFGGPKGKKFKYKQLNDLLLSITDKPMAEQAEILNKNFEDWKNNLEQVDDVLIIGIKM